MDARHGYWSIEFEEEFIISQLLILHSIGITSRDLRLVLRVSHDIFQEVMDQILEQCPGCIGIADAKDQMHDQNVNKLMQVACKYGLVFRIKFFGCCYDVNGVHPDPEKVEEIQDLKAPTKVNEVQQFLGTVQFISPFIPNLVDHTEIPCAMIRKESAWSWTPAHDKTFQKLKSLVCSGYSLNLILKKKTIIIQVDASQKGLGAALVQEGRPIAFVSKALMDVEQRYANIERELLAIICGCTRFHTCIYGSIFAMESDHKPLEGIQNKNLANTPTLITEDGVLSSAI